MVIAVHKCTSDVVVDEVVNVVEDVDIADDIDGECLAVIVVENFNDYCCCCDVLVVIVVVWFLSLLGSCGYDCYYS